MNDSYYDPGSIENYISLLPKNPIGTPPGHYITMNNMGTCENYINDLVFSFMKYAKNKKAVLDVGCGYGAIAITTQQFAKSTKVYACDIEPRHIGILNIMANGRGAKVHTITGDFTKLDDEKLPSFDAILFNKVLDLLTLDQLFSALKKAHKILNPYGKIFILCISPYAKVFNERLKEKVLELDSKYPLLPFHMVNNHIEGLPRHISVFSKFSLSALLATYGFEVDDLRYMEARPVEMREGSGRDFIACIAHKIP